MKFLSVLLISLLASFISFASADNIDESLVKFLLTKNADFLPQELKNLLVKLKDVKK